MVDLLKKGGKTVEQAGEIVDKIIAIAELTAGRREVSLIDADPDDNMVLGCALEAEADYLVNRVVLSEFDI